MEKTKKKTKASIFTPQKYSWFPSEQYNRELQQALRERQQYFHDKGYDQFVYVDNPDKSYSSDLVEKASYPLNGNEVLQEWIDSEFDELYNQGELMLKGTPDVEVTGIPHLNLFTYPIGGEYFPWTGHSEIIGPGGFHIDMQSNDSNYTLLNNNCAWATYRALKDIFGDQFDPEGLGATVHLPVLVEKLAKSIPGAKIYDDEEETEGYRRISIPIYDMERFNRIKFSTSNGKHYTKGYQKRDWRNVPSLNPDWKTYRQSMKMRMSTPQVVHNAYPTKVEEPQDNTKIKLNYGK